MLVAANAIVRVLLAPECAACGAVLDAPLTSPVCAACWRAIPLPPPPVRDEESLVTLACSGGRYDGSLREIIHALKYHRRRMLAAPLGRLMREHGGDVLAGADAVVPVPLHWWRERQRGFNQADDLARAVGLPVWRVLRRRRAGPPQAGLPASRRHANVRNAFALNHIERARPRAWRRLPNSTVVLVDDVMTTGATLEACARVLRGAGARTVHALTAARAVATRPSPPP